MSLIFAPVLGLWKRVMAVGALPNESCTIFVFFVADCYQHALSVTSACRVARGSTPFSSPVFSQLRAVTRAGLVRRQRGARGPRTGRHSSGNCNNRTKLTAAYTIMFCKCSCLYNSCKNKVLVIHQSMNKVGACSDWQIR